MPIDPRIAMGVQPLQLPDPVNQLARVMQVRGMQEEQQMNRLRMGEYQRGITEKNRLLSLLQGGADAEGLRKGGFLKESLDMEKAGAEAAHKKAQTGREEAEALIKRAGFFRDQLAGVTNPQQATAWLQAQYADPVLGGVMQRLSPLDRAASQIPTDPAAFEQWRQQNGLGLAKFMEFTTPNANAVLGAQTTMRGQNMTDARAREEGAANRGVTMRGQNMTDARARETVAQGKTQIVETPQGFVIVDKNTGQSRPATGADGQPLKGKANDRVMTDAQAKANLFGTRMSESHRILSDLEGQYSPYAVNTKMGAGELPVVGGALGYAGNLMLSEQGQRAEQAQRDFINAVLRRESGAVISQPEFANGQKQYFPQPGDTKTVLDQKRRNRELAIRGMEAEVPGGFRTLPTLTNPGSTGAVNGAWGIQRVN